MRPNFVVFVVDQMQARSLSLHGHPDVKTPNLDQLGREGISFARAYCNNPVCMPSRATLLTGLTPRQHGCLTNGNKVPEWLPTLPAILKQHGYVTHAVGKLHHQPVGSVSKGGEMEFSWESRERWERGEITSLPQGYYGYEATELVGGHVDCYGDYLSWLEQELPGGGRALLREGSYAKNEQYDQNWKIDLPERLHYNRWIARRSSAFLESLRSDQPFYLWCSFPDPHHPFAACRPYSEMYPPEELTLPEHWDTEADSIDFLKGLRDVHPGHSDFDEPVLREILSQTYGMISHVDSCIGEVLGKLKQLGLYENTVITFMADHGEYLGSHRLLTKAEWPWEELFNVPFLWKSPGSTAQGVQPEAVVSLLDFVPTVLDFAGIAPSCLDTRGVYSAKPWGLPGRSLRAAVESGAALEPRPALIEYDEDWYAPETTRLRSLVMEQYKLTLFTNTEEGLLFDLAADPYEQRNVWSEPQYQQLRLEMTERLLRELIRTDRLDTYRITGA
ncbi:sulfatase [Paenibacillus algicola]|uniref:Sulfatase n=1 Tax=Paenibacillus algicola TaxID=2565926 RepID=A0A4P8XLK1_9BACL|nr:sulfatase-like hydrolase/transferase [Paenibacillus algicola]QCT03657.1 sulfatase [Paenibacillus algicola]